MKVTRKTRPPGIPAVCKIPTWMALGAAFALAACHDESSGTAVDGSVSVATASGGVSGAGGQGGASAAAGDAGNGDGPMNAQMVDGGDTGLGAETGSHLATLGRGESTLLDGSCRILPSDVFNGSASAVWLPAGAKQGLYGEVRGTFSAGDLIPACGVLHRLVSSEAGSSGGAVIDLDATAAPAGTSLSPNGVAIPVGGDGLVYGKLPAPAKLSVLLRVKALTETAGVLTANLEVREALFKDPSGPPSDVMMRTFDVKVGDFVTATNGGGKFKISNVVRKDASAGIGGWVEIDLGGGS
jgi:hypothetical protein